jgi:putative acetyltransferase
MTEVQIAPADLADPQVRDLIAFHQGAMIAGSPPGHSFALNLSGLQTPDITVWAVHVEGRVAAIGALKRIDPERGEVYAHPSRFSATRVGGGTAGNHHR